MEAKLLDTDTWNCLHEGQAVVTGLRDGKIDWTWTGMWLLTSQAVKMTHFCWINNTNMKDLEVCEGVLCVSLHVQDDLDIANNWAENVYIGKACSSWVQNYCHPWWKWVQMYSCVWAEICYKNGVRFDVNTIFIFFKVQSFLGRGEGKPPPLFLKILAPQLRITGLEKASKLVYTCRFVHVDAVEEWVPSQRTRLNSDHNDFSGGTVV